MGGVRNKKVIVGMPACSLHSDTRNCRGELQTKVSNFGGCVTACAEAWYEIDAPSVTWTMVKRD